MDLEPLSLQKSKQRMSMLANMLVPRTMYSFLKLRDTVLGPALYPILKYFLAFFDAKNESGGLFFVDSSWILDI